MRYDMTIEIDENLVKKSGLQPDEYIRQEMGWLEDSGIKLASIRGREESEITGNEGIYSLGNMDGREYVANVFRSDEEPGYVNFSLFNVEDGQMHVIESGFYNNYDSIEDCVRDLAADGTMLNNTDIRFVAYCSWEINSIEEYRQALDEGRLEEPIPVPSWNQIVIGNQTMSDTMQHEELLESIVAKTEAVASEKPDGKETFYFSFGTSPSFPFELGWVEVQAKDRMEACEMYSSHYPKRDGLINASFVYGESEWKQSGLGREELGHGCHQVITDWGPHSERGHAKAELLAAGFAEGLIEERSDMPMQITPEMGSKLLALHYKMEDMRGLCPGVFWCHDEEGTSFTVLDNRGDEFRVEKFPSGIDCMAYLDGLSPTAGWEKRYGIEDLDARVNDLAGKTVCPVMPDSELSEWDMHRYGYERGGMLPVGAEKAEVLFEKVPLHCLHPDGLSTPLRYHWEIDEHAERDGLFGVTTVNWMEHLADAGIVRVEETPLWQALYGPDEAPIEDLAKQARDRAAERNAGRQNVSRSADSKGIDR